MSLLLTLAPWRTSLWLIALLGAAMAVAVARLMPPVPRAQTTAAPRERVGGGRGGFPLLFAIGLLDTGVRMGLLIFLRFLLRGKGASLPAVGLALALVFPGGAAGKFACDWLGDAVGVNRATAAAAMVALATIPLAFLLASRFLSTPERATI